MNRGQIRDGKPSKKGFHLKMEAFFVVLKKPLERIEENPMSYVKALKCRECGQEYEKTAKYVCEFCFGPLEAAYDYEKIKKDISREKIASRPLNIWRYRDPIPVERPTPTTLKAGQPPLIPPDPPPT